MRARPLLLAGLTALVAVCLWMATLVYAAPPQPDPHPAPQPAGPAFTTLVPAPPGPASFGENPDRATAGRFSAETLDPGLAARRVSASSGDPFRLFSPYATFPVEGETRSVGIGDFNDDGRPDVALTAGQPLNRLYVFTQTVTGTLATSLTYTTGPFPDALAIGDFNHDGRDDVAIAHLEGDDLGVYLQLPGGGLGAPVLYPTADGPNALAVGDLNDDGWDDLAVSHRSVGLVGVFLQRADGTLDPMAAYAAPQAGFDDLAIGDLNNDGRDDLVKMNGQFEANPTLSIFLQNQGGSLDPAIPYDLANTVGNGVAIGDLNRDGRDDVALTSGGNRPFAHLTVITQTITGTLGLTSTQLALDLPEALELADLNADGLEDALVAHGGWSSLTVYLQKPGGFLAPYQVYELPAPGAGHYGSQALATGDLNGDGLTDAAIADGPNGLVVLYHLPPQALIFLPFVHHPVPETETPIFDDFSDSASGWPTILSTFVDFHYLNGEYRIFAKRDFVSALATAGHRLSDLDVSVTGRREGSPTGGYGVSFGFTDSVPVEEYYALIVWPDFQEWNLFRFSFGSGFETLFWGLSTTIQPGGGDNRMRVLRQGQALSLFVNGVQVFGTNLYTYNGSRLTGLLQSPLELFHDARFDDYQLTVP